MRARRAARTHQRRRRRRRAARRPYPEEVRARAGARPRDDALRQTRVALVSASALPAMHYDGVCAPACFPGPARAQPARRLEWQHRCQRSRVACQRGRAPLIAPSCEETTDATGGCAAHVRSRCQQPQPWSCAWRCASRRAAAAESGDSLFARSTAAPRRGAVYRSAHARRAGVRQHAGRAAGGGVRRRGDRRAVSAQLALRRAAVRLAAGELRRAGWWRGGEPAAAAGSAASVPAARRGEPRPACCRRSGRCRAVAPGGAGAAGCRHADAWVRLHPGGAGGGGGRRVRGGDGR